MAHKEQPRANQHPDKNRYFKSKFSVEKKKKTEQNMMTFLKLITKYMHNLSCDYTNSTKSAERIVIHTVIILNKASNDLSD